MATQPTLPLFDEPATPSPKPSRDDSSTSTDELIREGYLDPDYRGKAAAEGAKWRKFMDDSLDAFEKMGVFRGSASDEERQEHVARLKAAGELTFDPQEDLKRPWWETLTVTEAQDTLARYEREAQQSQSLAAGFDPFDDFDDLEDFYTSPDKTTPEKPWDDGW